VSSRDRGRCRPVPTTPSNATGAVVVVDVVVLVPSVGVVDGGDGGVVLVTDVDAVLITVVTVVEPHDASRRSAPAASSHRPITRGIICRANIDERERICLLS
jgi:hypothetical protein